MCGIVFAHNGKKDETVDAEVKAQFLRQKNRGTQGFGMAGSLNGGKVSLYRTPDQVDAMIALWHARSSTLLFHHRTPTSSENTERQAHPIDVKLGKETFLVAHNGVICNRLVVRATHEEMGLKYVTDEKRKTVYYKSINEITEWNDSEALAWEVALAALHQKDRPLQCRAHGSIAFVALHLSEDGTAKEVLFGRNGFSALNAHHGGKNRLFLSSEGAGNEVEADWLHRYDLKTGKLTKRKFILPTAAMHDDWEREKKAKEAEEAKRKNAVTIPLSGTRQFQPEHRDDDTPATVFTRDREFWDRRRARRKELEENGKGTVREPAGFKLDKDNPGVHKDDPLSKMLSQIPVPTKPDEEKGEKKSYDVQEAKKRCYDAVNALLLNVIEDADEFSKGALVIDLAETFEDFQKQSQKAFDRLKDDVDSVFMERVYDKAAEEG